MQLKNKKWPLVPAKPSVRNALTIATCTVLSSSLSTVSFAEEEVSDLSKIGLSTFFYSEEERVSVNTTHVAIENDLGDDSFLRANVIYDTITGASPNGRIIPAAANGGNIPFTSASGFSISINDNGSTGKRWLTEFTDKRAALNLSLEKPITRNLKGIIEGNYSSENDFISYGAAGTISWDLNQRNTTITSGLGVLNESVEPASGTPLGLGVSNCNDTAPVLPTWANCNITSPRFGNGKKRMFDGMIGVTQIVNQRTITQLNYSLGLSLGYLTDPYKLISVVDNTIDGEEVMILYENRPDRRTKHSLYWKTVSQLSEKKVVDFSYRYFWDDWGITSHTFDYKYRYDYEPKSYLQPHIRYNLQSSADFFQRAIDSSVASLPQYASADYRLGKLSTYTVGLKYGHELGVNGTFTVRAEYIIQSYSEVDLPNMKALVYQGTFTFKFE
ncbi:FIG01057804: hypothetical protein [hydrothermal vent metagenome]|uniref:DUF3570 domain-containing protein n=1 Tax=hydrothermal vent metagenome TaxID=652676 RepID=A0A3B0ZLJ6_9ZZZZ